MRKKQSQVAKVQTLLSQEPNISAQEMSKKLGIPLKRVYVLRSVAKKKTATTVKSITSKPSRKGSAKTYRENLEKENAELQRIAMYWRDAYHKIEAEHRGSSAVIRYLETKLITLVQGK